MGLLIEKGASVDQARFDGGTPLLLAAWLGNVDVVVELLRGGADPRATDKAGRTILDLMVQRLGHPLRNHSETRL